MVQTQNWQKKCFFACVFKPNRKRALIAPPHKLSEVQDAISNRVKVGV